MTSMLSRLADLPTPSADWTLAVAPILAQTSKSYNISWAIVLFLVALGLIVALSPARRTYEVKKPKDE